MSRNDDAELDEELAKQANRLRRAEQERSTLLAQTVYLGTLGLVFVLPVVGGAYLGNWIDGQADGYSMRWTLSLIVLGVVVGVVNAWLLLRG
jgi:ATP synthase protein I